MQFQTDVWITFSEEEVPADQIERARDIAHELDADETIEYGELGGACYRKVPTMRARIGRWLCRRGLHKWGTPYATASDFWGFGCGHHRQDCQRPGCNWQNNHWPS